MKFSKINPSFRNGRFYNPDHVTRSSLYNILHTAYSMLHEVYIFIKSLKNGKNRDPINADLWLEKNINIEKNIEKKSDNSIPVITWIGHATVLIQINGKNIITDPIFGSPTFLFPRIFPPAIALENLPQIDYVLISHNHMDHMHMPSLLALKQLYPEVKVLVPYGDKGLLDKKGFKECQSFMWWESILDKSVEKNGIEFTFLPAQHWSQRTLFDQNKSLWGSWMIEYNNYKIYFAGDTAYASHFRQIAREYPDIDVALMPVGPCEPREKMCSSHISSEEAGDGFLELGARHFIPMHWGTFHFGTDFFETPIIRLNNWWKDNIRLLESKHLNILKLGQSFYIDKSYAVRKAYDSVQTSNLKEIS